METKLTIKNVPIYFITNPSIWNISFITKEACANHAIGSYKKRLCISPNGLSEEIVTPDNLFQFKLKYEIEKIILIDRVKNSKGWVQITDHVNKSGTHFLRGKTPWKNKSQFPDVSKIYSTGNVEINQKTVHTVGDKRFQSVISDESKPIISEGAGLVSTVFNYIGVKVFAFGGNPERENVEDVFSYI